MYTVVIILIENYKHSKKDVIVAAKLKVVVEKSPYIFEIKDPWTGLKANASD